MLKNGTASPARTGDPQIHNLGSIAAVQTHVEPRAAILAAFYHRTRRQFVLWTTEEIAARTGIPLLSVAAYLRSLKEGDEARSIAASDPSLPKSWYLTPRGQGAAIAALKAKLEGAA